MTVEADPFLRGLLDAALSAADPSKLVPPHLPPPPAGRTFVVGAGKAAASMAKAMEDHWNGSPPIGVVVVPHGYAVPTRTVEVVEAPSPITEPIAGRVAERALALAAEAGPDDLVLALVSGGASALLTLPAPGLGFEETRQVNDALKNSGATLAEINTVRKHLSAVKGGHLGLAAAPAKVVAMVIADIAGADPSVVGSGPTIPDRSTQADAREILDRYRIARAPNVDAFLADPANETPKPGEPRLDGVSTVVLSSPQQALDTAAEAAKTAGVTPVVLGDAVQGHARDIAAVQASLARESAAELAPVLQPRVLLSGGETSHTSLGEGRGGRNTLFLLALAVALDGHPGISAIACDTDGIDGVEDNAGAIIRPDTLARAAERGLDPRACLAENDAYSFFEALDDLVVTGPTLTNVNDLRAILVT